MEDKLSIIIDGKKALTNLRRKGSTTAIMKLVKELPKAIILTGTREQYINIMKTHNIDIKHHKNLTVSENPQDYSSIDAPVIIDTSYLLTIFDSINDEIVKYRERIRFRELIIDDYRQHKNRLAETFNRMYSYYPKTWWSKTEKHKIETEDPIDAAIRFIKEYQVQIHEAKEKRFKQFHRIKALKYGRVKIKTK